jgi:hypothetical protein
MDSDRLRGYGYRTGMHEWLLLGATLKTIECGFPEPPDLFTA